MTVSDLADSKWTRGALQDRSRRTLQGILEAAERLMVARPFSELAVAEIAREARVSIGSFYARFSDKQALLGAVFERDIHNQRSLFDELLSPERWQGTALVRILRQTFPLILASYRQRQGLIRAYLEEAWIDVRFRETWAESGAFVVDRVTQLVLARRAEIDHPHPERAVRLGLEMVFATLVHRIRMREMDAPDIEELADELLRMMQRLLGIQDQACA